MPMQLEYQVQSAGFSFGYRGVLIPLGIGVALGLLILAGRLGISPSEDR